jgi:hypothetical protein
MVLFPAPAGPSIAITIVFGCCGEDTFISGENISMARRSGGFIPDVPNGIQNRAFKEA